MNKPRVEYSDEVAAAICARLADGESLKKICESEGMPARSSVHKWLATNPEFLTMYQVAWDEKADGLFDEMQELMNQDPPADLDPKQTMAWVQNKRVKLETLRWILARMAPKKFSERYEITGAAGEALIPQNDEMTPERLLEGARRMIFVLNRADQILKENPPAPLRLVHEVKP
jgi:hypothetical protein